MEKPEDIENKRREFLDKVDAGEFDDIIRARDIHEGDQMDEALKRLSSPITPDELIEAVEFDEDMKRSDEDVEELKRRMELDPSLKARIEEMEKRIGENMLKYIRGYKEKGRMWALRERFKRDPQNFEAYLQGRLQR